MLLFELYDICLELLYIIFFRKYSLLVVLAVFFQLVKLVLALLQIGAALLIISLSRLSYISYLLL